ncbi:MAG TPA: AraC family transcriptional regulator ligand-binding domain-containing protein [Steroidobacteraceae bacterium]|nr:AraC family transcriptional regulator ligand-binding domain-containing protein [Steroidobacteraceae bacterium]HQR48048.1 AraC family transcriptional regulator ligand-binding domain-containing protein [Steroidobacteraceae bacterium]
MPREAKILKASAGESGRVEPAGPARPAPAAGPAEQGCPVGALVQLPDLMREAGHDPWSLLESFGVTQAMMAQPMTPIPLTLYGQILQAAADAIGRDDLGLLLGQRATMENAGPLRLLVLNSRTTGEAVESYVRYGGLWYHGLKITMTLEQGYACIALSSDRQFVGRDHVLTWMLAATVKHLEAIFPRSWRPSQVHISYRRPKQAEAYARFFRAPVLYDQLRHAVFFPAAALDEVRPGSQANLDSFLRQYMGELEAREQPDFVSRVRRVIESLLASGECSIVRVAAMFSMHRVTLHRYLREQGTTFEDLLDDARRELAGRMLEQTNLPVGEIATALGYGNAGSFVRAFKRWNGVTPGAGRRRRPGIARAASPGRLAARRT